jgi:hypothetical protein
MGAHLINNNLKHNIMTNENEIVIKVEGKNVIEQTIVSTTHDKVEYLVQKEKELEEHDLGVTAYIESSNAKRAELVKLIADING